MRFVWRIQSCLACAAHSNESLNLPSKKLESGCTCTTYQDDHNNLWGWTIISLCLPVCIFYWTWPCTLLAHFWFRDGHERKEKVVQFFGSSSQRGLDVQQLFFFFRVVHFWLFCTFFFRTGLSEKSRQNIPVFSPLRYSAARGEIILLYSLSRDISNRRWVLSRKKYCRTTAAPNKTAWTCTSDGWADRSWSSETRFWPHPSKVGENCFSVCLSGWRAQ